MKELASQDLAYERQMWPRAGSDRLLHEARRAAQGAADRGEDRRPVRGLGLHDQGSRHLRRLLRRPARAVDRPAEGLQAADHVERLLEGRRQGHADAARLRHGVLQRQGAAGAPARGSRKRRSATTASSGASSACSRSTRGRRAPRSGSPRARRSTTRSRDYMRGVLFPAGYVGSEDAAPLQQGAVGARPATGRTTGENMFLVRVARRRGRWA